PSRGLGLGDHFRCRIRSVQGDIKVMRLRKFPDSQDVLLFSWPSVISSLLIYGTVAEFARSDDGHYAYLLSQVALGILLIIAFLTFNAANKKERAAQTTPDAEDSGITGHQRAK